MNWKNLKDNACPKCTGLLAATPTGYKCTHDIGAAPCDFFITRTKFESIVQSMYHPKKFQRDLSADDRLSELNNHGHNFRSKDFEDSAYADRRTRLLSDCCREIIELDHEGKNQCSHCERPCDIHSAIGDN